MSKQARIRHSPINKSECKKRIMAAMETRIPGKFTRVSESTMTYLEDLVLAAIMKIVTQHPSKGKTITPPIV